MYSWTQYRAVLHGVTIEWQHLELATRFHSKGFTVSSSLDGEDISTCLVIQFLHNSALRPVMGLLYLITPYLDV